MEVDALPINQGAKSLQIIKDGRRDIGVSKDHRTILSRDTCFLKPNRFAGMAEPLAMIDIDAGHQGHIGINDIDGIKPPTQTDFKDSDIEVFLSKEVQRCQGSEFEKT